MLGSAISGEREGHPRRDESHEELRDWLQDHNLSDIYNDLITFEFHEPDHLRVMREEDLDRFADTIGLRFGKYVDNIEPRKLCFFHSFRKGRFLHAVESLRNRHRREVPRALRVVVSQEEQLQMDMLARKATNVEELFDEMTRRVALVDDSEKRIKEQIKERTKELIHQIQKNSTRALRNAEKSAQNLRVVLQEKIEFLENQQTLIRQVHSVSVIVVSGDKLKLLESGKV